MSGKNARKLRKNHSFSKKALALCAGVCLTYAPVAAGGEFLVSVYPHFTKPIGEAHSIEYGMGAGVKATYRPVKFLNIFAEGDYQSMALPGIAPMTLLEGSVGTGYHLDLTDRLALDLNIKVGAYNAKTTKSISGISAGGALTFTYKITPSIYADVNATASHYAGKPKPLMMVNAGLAPGITFNVTEFFNKETHIDIEGAELAPVFPVLYSWYENNSFGKVNVTNNEDSSITDVTVSFFQPQYMAHAKECAHFKKIKKGETVDVDLFAFFNEQMLELTERSDTNSYIIVNYSRLGKKLSQTYAMDVPVYGRNNMSWDDDRRAAVFVSSKDPAAMQFAKYTASIVRDNLRVDMPVNIQYAIGIFQALNEFGLNYVVDPSSAFEDNVGTSSIDFLQFPYQTLMYRGGDCDDISILVCSLFEAVGIDTAFITVPGHIFMAFDSGLTPDQAKSLFRNSSEYIVDGEKVWMPLEITLSDEGFFRACRYGAREWNAAAAQGAAALYPMSDSWKIYQPISVPGATAYFNIPESEAILLAFNKGADEWKRGELKNDTLMPQIQFVVLEQDEPEETELVIKGNPLSSKTLKDIVALANNTAAIVPPAVREEDDQNPDGSGDGGADGDGKGSGSGDGYDEFEDDELLENIIPLDYAIATLQTDVSVKQGSEPPVVEFAQSASIETTETSENTEPETTVAESVDQMSLSGLTGQSRQDDDSEIAVSSTAMTENDDYSFDTTDSFMEALERLSNAEPEPTPVVEPVDQMSLSGLTGQSSQDDDSDDTPFETTESFLKDLENAAAEQNTTEAESNNAVVELAQSASIETTDDNVVSTGSTTKTTANTRTRNIIIITSVTLAAALAAGIIIYRKKIEREEESK